MSDHDGTVDPALEAWLREALGGDEPFTLRRLSGGNSNDTLELSSGERRWIVRRPPAEALSPSAHNLEREQRILAALAATDVPSPAPVALCDDGTIPGAPFLVMEAIDGISLTDRLPAGYPAPDAAVGEIGNVVVDALAALHTAPWRRLGLEDFGRPEGFLERQVPRWRRHLERHRVRDIPFFEAVGEWLAANAPPETQPAILHGDFHVDNCLLSLAGPIRVEAIIDWEMATIGDPLLDLGLFLALWGPDRPDPAGLTQIQAVTRHASAPSRAALAARYAERSGRSVEHLDWYLALALWKLGAIIEGAYAQYLAGTLLTDYARDLEHDVPRLVREAAIFAGLTR